MATLGIKGHKTRGKEVIQLLEMLGGKNTFHVLGTEYGLVCYIDDKNNIFQMQINDYNPCSNYTIFTLEEFLEKFPYKVGDKVKAWINGYCSICNIRDMEWDSIVNEIKYKIQDYWYSTMNLQPYKEEIMEKINIAELLKDCPIGMELDCTIYEDVILNKIDNSPEREYPIQIVTRKGYLLDLTKYGTYTDIEEAKCVIFPKGKTSWEGFVPPCEFKDGDIISTSYYDDICIFKDEGNIKGTVDFYCGISGNSDELLIKDVKNQDEHFGDIDEYKLATEEEKEKLFKVIKYNGYVWNEETKSLEKLPKIKVNDRVKKKSIDDVDAVKIAKIIQSIHTFTNKFDITTLKPFQKVLVRDSDEEYWSINLFGFYNEITKQYCCMGNTDIGWDECIPYEGNEHLLGTTNDCDEFYKIW